jgi:hypothetical protein
MHFPRFKPSGGASAGCRGRRGHAGLMAVLIALALPTRAHASMFHGETLDKIADILSWIVLIVSPVIGIVVFWLVHILPEKIAEKKRHPQAKAIQVLCLLSLAFGGLLWPLAWLWAYSKPVLHKLAYGTDVAPEHEHAAVSALASEVSDDEAELQSLRRAVADLESRISSKASPKGGKT